jgi:hypothetical protein
VAVQTTGRRSSRSTRSSSAIRVTSRRATDCGRAAATSRQSSSGLIVSTGAGATGWCRSIWQQCHSGLDLPAPTEPRLAWFVREAWPSPATGTTLVEGERAPGETLRIVAETDGLVVFGDGIESDRLVLAWGQEVKLKLAGRALRLARFTLLA